MKNPFYCLHICQVWTNECTLQTTYNIQLSWRSPHNSKQDKTLTAVLSAIETALCTLLCILPSCISQHTPNREHSAAALQEFQLHSQLGNMTYKQVLSKMKLFCISDTGIECHRKSWVGTPTRFQPFWYTGVNPMPSCLHSQGMEEHTYKRTYQRTGFGQTSEELEERKQKIHLSCSQLLSSLII